MKKTIKIFLIAISILVAIMVLIKVIPGSEKVIPEPVYSFADKFAIAGVAVTLVVIGALMFNVLPIAAVALIVVGVSMLYFTYFRKSE